jgi:hypothetical protein
MIDSFELKESEIDSVEEEGKEVSASSHQLIKSIDQREEEVGTCQILSDQARPPPASS